MKTKVTIMSLKFGHMIWLFFEQLMLLSIDIPFDTCSI